ncbi:contact-dependent growth inhibition system immunity protein [Zobellia nedashkovskayae]|uniref:contact-dependent growth inhibition system immunity protein n=1 Tax=Zobellia nedashkovskayae TaxID=2779510 RepID=UPI00188D0E17|nr:contact-dependent growth inhibition system immunity protein [Zobellia nedashkovskayae]
MGEVSKSIEELENDYWKEPTEFQTDLIEKCFRYRKISVNQLTIEQIRLLISQQIGLEYLIGPALIKLERNPLAEGDFYKGDLLSVISKTPIKIWGLNRKELRTFKNLVENNSEVLKAGLGEKRIDEITERIKKAYAQHNL